MPTTRKKQIKTVYKDEDDSEEAGDFSDSGSEAKFSDDCSSEEGESEHSSGDQFINEQQKKSKTTKAVKKTNFAKSFVKKLDKQNYDDNEDENCVSSLPLFSVKDLTEADKLLPSILNLSESDSSDDESDKVSKNLPSQSKPISYFTGTQNKTDSENKTEYKDVWSDNLPDHSEDIAHKTFLELEKHKLKIEETKASLQNYSSKVHTQCESDVKDLLAQGEEILPHLTSVKNKKNKIKKEDSESDLEDWEEVNESKEIPQHGLQLFVEFPDAVAKKSKKLDVEMMMRRKLNRVKKEYQVYMHKVHVLCWIGHGNYISTVLNSQEIMAAALSLIPSKECYPGVRVDMKYIEQITAWYIDKLTIKQDKHEDKFKPKAPPLKEILVGQIKKKVLTSKKYLVFIFVAMLRSLGLQCRIVFNFVTLPIKPHSSELCSLSTKPNKDGDKSKAVENKDKVKEIKKNTKPCPSKPKKNISQVDGNYDCDDCNLMQVDGSDDAISGKKRTTRSNTNKAIDKISDNEGVSPPKRSKRQPSKELGKDEKSKAELKKKSAGECFNNSNNDKNTLYPPISKRSVKNKPVSVKNDQTTLSKATHLRQTRTSKTKKIETVKKEKPPQVIVTDDKEVNIESKYFGNKEAHNLNNRLSLSRKRSCTTNPLQTQNTKTIEIQEKVLQTKTRTRSAPGSITEKSEYFGNSMQDRDFMESKLKLRKLKTKQELSEDKQRVSHKQLTKSKPKTNDVTKDLIQIIKNRVKESKDETNKHIVKGKLKQESDSDSDYLPEEKKQIKSGSDDDFKPTKITPKRNIHLKPSSSKKKDRRVLSSDDELPKNKTDVWCEIFVEELEQWIAVDIINNKIHAAAHIYSHTTHPVCYVVGWDNNNYLKDLTRRYVPHWNTVTRKQRAEPQWWSQAIQPWLGPKTARDRDEDENLDRMQLEAPLPKSIAEYKNHPLYALKRHLLKFEAIYPSDAATLGFVRGEAVYARGCVHVCRSRDTWLKEAKVVRAAQEPYKVVKARPKWDKLSNKMITDKPLEVFGPWQVQDYEPPVAENGLVPRNAYGNVELFKECMLPKGTVHIKLPGLSKVAKKLNIDCAPAMTGFDFNGGWSHPVYDGFVVCKEFEEIITEAWIKDQEEQQQREIEKTEARVYGNWKRLIKGLFIRERLKNKYGFEEPATSQSKNKSKGPRLVVKKRS